MNCAKENDGKTGNLSPDEMEERLHSLHHIVDDHHSHDHGDE